MSKEEILAADFSEGADDTVWILGYREREKTIVSRIVTARHPVYAKITNKTNE